MKCKCGHTKEFHDLDTKGCCIYGIEFTNDSVNCDKRCSCEKYLQDTNEVKK